MKSKGWKKEDQPSKKMSSEREENFYNMLSNYKEQFEGKFEKMEVVEEEDEEMKSKEEFIAYITKKERRHHKNRKTKNKEKSEIKRLWYKNKDKMDELVKVIDKIDLEKIQYNVQEIDGLCKARNIGMIKPRKEKRKERRTNGSR